MIKLEPGDAARFLPYLLTLYTSDLRVMVFDVRLDGSDDSAGGEETLVPCTSDALAELATVGSVQ